MNTREKFSVGLLSLGIILTLLPLSASRSFIIKPEKLISELFDEKTYMTVDQVAKFLVSEDSTIMIYDLRTPQEFKNMNIPGSVNIPYSDILNNENDLYLNDRSIKKIFYSNGDFDSNYAYAIARGLNYRNVYVMKGGMNEWFNTVMNSSFTGEKISARENALFETRFRARKIFNDINSLPDSLKTKYFEARSIAATKLDGGCE